MPSALDNPLAVANRHISAAPKTLSEARDAIIEIRNAIGGAMQNAPASASTTTAAETGLTPAQAYHKFNELREPKERNAFFRANLGLLKQAKADLTGLARTEYAFVMESEEKKTR